MAHTRLQVSEKAVVGGVVLVLVGEVDFGTIDILDDALVSATAPVVVADLAAVTFIDSVGLTTLVRAHRDLEDEGGRLALAGAGEGVRRVMEITGIDHVLALYPTVRAALNPVNPESIERRYSSGAV
ncbi:STAS domain-containing protein [Actinacidiphila rubida]|uniref:Anti-sigma factor antagonist n=1 Tax=Actinacidiphila rubida TaxID=310780 RepID=A0A1H8U4D5_9ACTN|nr:STAS domain-containing protein [Actinacidiphila rubida]SEO98005.1 anti-sigma B factor antagonist [Actinacidiphila rubida]